MFDPISTANEQHLRRLAHVQLDDVSLFLIQQARGRSRWDRFQQHDGVVVDMVESFPAGRASPSGAREGGGDAAAIGHPWCASLLSYIGKGAAAT